MLNLSLSNSQDWELVMTCESKVTKVKKTTGINWYQLPQLVCVSAGVGVPSFLT